MHHHVAGVVLFFDWLTFYVVITRLHSSCWTRLTLLSITQTLARSVFFFQLFIGFSNGLVDCKCFHVSPEYKLVTNYFSINLGCLLHREPEGEDEHHRHQPQGGVLLACRRSCKKKIVIYIYIFFLIHITFLKYLLNIIWNDLYVAIFKLTSFSKYPSCVFCLSLLPPPPHLPP